MAIFLSLLTLFFGVALFSSLHKHSRGNPTSCTFNNLEHQHVSTAEAAIVIVPLAVQMEAADPVRPPTPITRPVLSARDRSPPLYS